VKPTISIITVLLLLSSITSHAEQDKSTGEKSDDLESFASMYVEDGLTTLREKAPDKFKSQLERISYKIIDSIDPQILRVEYSNNSPMIEISTGAFDLLTNLATAKSASIFVENGSVKFANWSLEVGKNIREGNYFYPNFLQFTGDSMPSNEYFLDVFFNNLITSLSFILAHECSHVLLGHMKELNSELSSERIQSLEYQADDLAVDLLIAIAGNSVQDYQLYGSSYMEYFMFGMQLNRDILGHQSLRDHPPEPERSVRMARKFQKKVRDIFKNKEEIELLERVFDNRIREFQMYKLVLEYQNYSFTPGTENLSFEERRKKYGN